MRFEMEGLIGAAGFTSGDRVVVGHWARSPIGPMSDVMWAEPDGRRVLYAPDERVAAFVTAIYRFDEVVVGEMAVDGSAAGLRVGVTEREVHLQPGRARRLPGRGRPAWFTRWVEGPVARVALHVRTYGVSPSGVREWYRADSWAPLTGAAASIGGRDLGAMAEVSPPCRFGFSEAPKRPSITAVRPLLEDPSGRLDQVVADLTGVGT
jgi:hypothetical protein